MVVRVAGPLRGHTSVTFANAPHHASDRSDAPRREAQRNDAREFLRCQYRRPARREGHHVGDRRRILANATPSARARLYPPGATRAHELPHRIVDGFVRDHAALREDFPRLRGVLGAPHAVAAFVDRSSQRVAHAHEVVERAHHGSGSALTGGHARAITPPPMLSTENPIASNASHGSSGHGAAPNTILHTDTTHFARTSS